MTRRKYEGPLQFPSPGASLKAAAEIDEQRFLRLLRSFLD